MTTQPSTPLPGKKVTMQDIVEGSPKGQKAVDKAIKASIAAQNKTTAQATPLADEVEQILEKHYLWVVKNVEHGIYIPLPSPETKAVLDQAYAKQFLEILPKKFAKVEIDGMDNESACGAKMWNSAIDDIRAAVNKMVGAQDES